jgi:hypothetical protein
MASYAPGLFLPFFGRPSPASLPFDLHWRTFQFSGIPYECFNPFFYYYVDAHCYVPIYIHINILSSYCHVFKHLHHSDGLSAEEQNIANMFSRILYGLQDKTKHYELCHCYRSMQSFVRFSLFLLLLLLLSHFSLCLFQTSDFFFLLMDPFRHLVGLLGRGISPEPRPLPTQDNTTQRNTITGTVLAQWYSAGPRARRSGF